MSGPCYGFIGSESFLSLPLLSFNARPFMGDNVKECTAVLQSVATGVTHSYNVFHHVSAVCSQLRCYSKMEQMLKSFWCGVQLTQ